MTDATTSTDLAVQELAAQDDGRRVSYDPELHRAQKMEAIGTLARGIAHDFNNILGSIVGNVELARQDLELGHPAHESLERIMRSSARARDLVRQILTFSQKDEGSRAPLQLGDIVTEGVALLRSTLPSSIELAADIALDCPEVLADASQMRQLFMNLCTNAYQAIGGGNGRLSIRLEVVDASTGPRPELRPGRWVRLEVRDDGSGMSAETMDRIFEPFFTTKPPGEGSGLGLSAVHGIVTASGGQIFVVSQPGQGALFEVYLPALDASLAPRRPSGQKARRGTGQNVLFVDDESELRRIGPHLLERLGYRVTSARSGAEALTLFRCSSFDLLITDLNMPAMNGLQLAAELRALQPGLKVILASGYSSEATREEACAIGVTEILPKPYDLDSLAGSTYDALHPKEPS